MYSTVKYLHSYWAYLVLILLIFVVIKSIVKYFGKKEYTAKDFRLTLFTLIVTHIQLLLGLLVYFVSPNGFSNLTTNGMGGLSSYARLLAVEHPFIGIVAIAILTIGYSKHKKKLISLNKFKTIALYYGIALLLILSRIPWNTWLQ